MATITPTPSRPVSGVEKQLWETITEADTAASVLTSGTTPAISSVQAVGTFGSATVVMQGSNDGTNWINLDDTTGTEIAFTAAGGAEFSSSYLYLRPSISGGTGQDIDVHLVMRG